jgi:beta-glucanase (GH16 family)
MAAPAWTQVWADDFNETAIDRSNWTYDLGGGGWGNNELQYYTDKPANSYILHDGSGDGMLVIEARKESYRGSAYTSARMKTQGLKNWAYGRMEARISIPGGRGVWPAFWMLGSNFPTVGWPACGEIDIFEHCLASDMPAYTVRGSAHGPGFFGANSVHGDWHLDNGLLNVFHIYAVEWEPNEIRWYFDGTLYFTATPNSLPSGGTWVFDHPFFLILNVAVGGSWPGSPDATTLFPAQMLVDYIRVFRDANLTEPSGSMKASIAMSTASSGPTWQAVATVTVTDTLGAKVGGATVRGAWSGLIRVGVTEKTTDANGVAVLNSGKVRQSGTIQFTVTEIVKAGLSYVPPPGGDSGSVTR